MEWKQEYSTGIAEIDNQHKVLLSHFGMIELLIASNASWSKVHRELQALQEYAKFHFQFEEALMRLFGYPESESHRAQHVSYLKEIDSKLTMRLNPYPDKAVLYLIEAWLVNHISQADQDYARHILSGARVVSAASQA